MKESTPSRKATATPARRPPGTGSIVEVSPGTWRVRVFVGRDPITNKKHQLERTVHGNRTAAEAKRKELEKKIDSGERGGTSASLGYVLEEYAKHCEARGRSNNYVDGIRRLATKVLPLEYQSLPVDQLTARHLDEWYRRLGIGDVPGIAKQSSSSVHRYAAVMTAALGQAVKWDWLDRNPAERSTLPDVPEAPRRRTPTPDEVRRFVVEAAKAREEYGMLALLAVATATRLGEFCASRWPDIDVADGVVRIDRTLFRASTSRGEKVTKGKRRREVALDPQLAYLLLRWRERCEKIATEHGVTLAPDAFIVSRWPDGSRPIVPNTFSAFQSRLAKELDIDLANAGRNPFRHAGGTEILAKTGSPRDGADVLGHADPSFFLRQYSHSTTARQIAAAGVLASMLPPPDELDLAKD